MVLTDLKTGYVSHTHLIRDPNSHVLAYLKQMSESGSTKKAPSPVLGQPPASQQFKVPRMTDADMAVRLNIIFEKIFNRDETKTGIQELYQFRKNYPYSAETIEERLSQTGSYFQGYIRRGLAHLEEEEQVALEDQANAASSFAPINKDHLARLSSEVSHKHEVEEEVCVLFEGVNYCI
jgi:hypothetical protein